MNKNIITINWLMDDSLIDEALECLGYPKLTFDHLGNVTKDWQLSTMELPAFWPNWKAVRDSVGQKEYYLVQKAFIEIEISELFSQALEFHEFPLFPATRLKFYELLELTNHRIGCSREGQITIVPED